MSSNSNSNIGSSSGRSSNSILSYLSSFTSSSLPQQINSFERSQIRKSKMTKGDSSSRSSSSSSSNKSDGNEKDMKRPETEEIRFYPFGNHGFVTYEEFLELPRGQDINEEDAQDEGSIDDERLRVYRTFQTKEEHDKANRWNLQEMPNTEVPFKLLTTLGKIEWVVSAFVKFCAIWGVLYLFIIALGVMGEAFKVLGGKSSGKTFRESELLSNPLAGLSIGILATVLMQSSSTTTSIVISMAASNLVTVKNAAYLVMGANIGTSVTNTIVSIAHLNSPEQYRRAFTSAVFHDMFNWLTVAMFLPLEASSGFLVELAGAAVDSMNLGDKQQKTEFIKKITKPASGRVVSVDKKLIEKIAQAKTSEEVTRLEKMSIIKKKSGFVLRDTPQSDDEAGLLLLFVSITMLCACLLLLVKLLQSVLKGKVAVYTRKVLNLDFQNKYLKMFGGLDSYILLLVGTGVTILVQSSSVFTSTLTPLVGIGLIHIEKVVALTHGANIGTTVTGVISALSGDNVDTGMRVALEHVFFNCLGTVIWFVIWPLRPVPLAAAKFLGETAANLRWFPLAYIIAGFVVLPTVIVGLSIPGWEVLVAVGIPVFLGVLFLAGWLWVRRNRADLLSRGGCLRSEMSPCGCAYPNWMQVWGGERNQDTVNMEELRKKEALAEAEQVAEWPTSPMAWGMALLAFLGLLLAIPTAQWRRIRYATEGRGRKEYGFGLWEVCTDDFKEDVAWATRPPLCDQAQVNECAKDLGRSCKTTGWASEFQPTSLEDEMYKSAWQTCSKLGCRVWDWLQHCPEMSECSANKEFHTNRCAAVVYDYKFFNHNQMDAKGVVYTYPGETSTVPPPLESTPAHSNVFLSGTSSSYKVSTFPVAPKTLNELNSVNAPTGLTASCTDCTETCGSSTDRKVCTDAPAFTGLAYDSCSGELLAVSGRGPTLGCTDGSAFVFQGFSPSMSKMSLTKARNSNSHLAEIGSTVPLKRTNTVGTISYANGLPSTNSWGTLYDAPSATAASTCTGTVAADTQGLDLGDVHVIRYKQGTTSGIYVGSDQYGAKIVFWDDNGEILATYVAATGANVANTIEILPSEFGSRDRTSGRVTMAINSAKSKMVVCSQVAMSSIAYLRNSPVVRCAVLDISNYRTPVLSSVKLILQNEASAEYSTSVRGVASTQSEVELVSAQWLSGDKVLFLEQGKVCVVLFFPPFFMVTIIILHQFFLFMLMFVLQ